MGYETRINSLAEEALDDAFNAAYNEEKDRLLNTEEGLRDLQAGIRLYYGPHHECQARLRTVQDVQRFGPIVASKMALAKAHERMKEIAAHNEDMMSDWRD